MAAVGAVFTAVAAVARIPVAGSVEDLPRLRRVTERRGPRLLGRRFDRVGDSRPGQVTPTQAGTNDLEAQHPDLPGPAMASGTPLRLPARNAEHRADHSRRARQLAAGASPAGIVRHRLPVRSVVSPARATKFGKIPARRTSFLDLNRFRRCTIRLAARSSRDPAPGQARRFPGARISPGDRRFSGVEQYREA